MDLMALLLLYKQEVQDICTSPVQQQYSPAADNECAQVSSQLTAAVWTNQGGPGICLQHATPSAAAVEFEQRHEWLVQFATIGIVNDLQGDLFCMFIMTL